MKVAGYYEDGKFTRKIYKICPLADFESEKTELESQGMKYIGSFRHPDPSGTEKITIIMKQTTNDAEVYKDEGFWQELLCNF